MERLGPQPRARNVLIVDDEPMILHFLNEALSPAGFTIHTASDAEDALGAIETAPPDVVLTDIAMPGMSGLELAHMLQARSPAIPTVLMSALSHPSRVGAFPFIGKPFDVPLLIATLSAAIPTVTCG